MKNIFKLALALAAFLVIGSGVTASAQKFGRINTSELLQAMPEIKTVEANLERIAEQHRQIFDQMVVEYNTKMEEFNKNSSTWTEAIRNSKQQEMAALGERLQNYQQTATDEISESQRTQMAPVIEKARAAISAVAKANGYAGIFDVTAGALAYFDEVAITDILPLVKKQLGIN